MSYVPNRAMKHAHVDAPADDASLADRAREAASHIHPPMWTMIAAGVGGAVATALLLSLRSSAPAPQERKARKPAKTKKKSA